MTEHYTNQFERDPQSNALLATDKSALAKHEHQKYLKNTVEYQQDKIDRLEQQIDKLTTTVYQLLEQNGGNQ